MTATDEAMHRLIAGLSPVRHPGTYVFACLDADAVIAYDNCVCVMRESEGLSVIAQADHVPTGARIIDYPAAWITLGVDSNPADVGLTAAVSQRLLTAGISCNVVADARHDHLFVPEAEAGQVMHLLGVLQLEARQALAPTESAAATSGTKS